MLHAGSAEVCITPPIGVELAGYGPDRDRFSTSIHDHLMAQALVLDDGQTRIALVTADLLGISPELAGAVRRQAEARAGIPAANVMICATHSHTAPTPAPTRRCGMPDAQYVRMLVRHLAGAVVSAAGQMQPAALHVGRGEHRWLAWNRVGGSDIDRTLTVLRIDRVDDADRPLALVVHYACHPVILGPKLVISADYPGALRDYINRHHPHTTVLFTNGTCGNIDPVTNREVWGQGTFDDVAKAGERLGEDALDAARDAALLNDPQITVRHGDLTLEYELPAPEVLEAKIAQYRAEARQMKGKSEAIENVATGIPPMPRFWLGYYRDLRRRIAQGKQPACDVAELQLFAFGPGLALLGIPAEVYAEQGLIMRQRSRFANTLPICYANGLYGYVPPRAAYERGSYAASLAAAVFDRPPFRSNVAETLIESVGRLLW